MTVIEQQELDDISGGNTQQELIDFVERVRRDWLSMLREGFPSIG